jgi:hypothetical protein
LNNVVFFFKKVYLYFLRQSVGKKNRNDWNDVK